MLISQVDKFNGYWVKREDMPCWTSLDYPSGSKVRQYTEMAKGAPGAPMIVGCSAHSAMQIYVAAAAKQHGVPGIIYIPARAEVTDATKYAANLDAQLMAVRPGYLNVVRNRAREAAKKLGTTVKWSVAKAMADTSAQCLNLPKEAKRIVVATGSGLTAAAILAYLHAVQRNTKLVAVATSPLATEDGIESLAYNFAVVPRTTFSAFPKVEIIRHPTEYSKHVVAALPDGTPLDPYYAAKALEYIQDGDVLWVPGLRPVCSMPKDCQEAFREWKGFVGSQGS